MRYSVMLLVSVLITVPTVALADFSYLWCNNADSVYADVNPANGAVTLFHDAAIYNCCPDPATFTITTTNQTVRVVELVTEAAPCDCDCCFNLSVTVGDLAAGQWTVIYEWFDFETGAFVERELVVEVPDISTGPPPVLANIFMSDCQGTSGVPEDIVEYPSWSWVKGVYR